MARVAFLLQPAICARYKPGSWPILNAVSEKIAISCARYVSDMPHWDNLPLTDLSVAQSCKAIVTPSVANELIA